MGMTCEEAAENACLETYDETEGEARQPRGRGEAAVQARESPAGIRVGYTRATVISIIPAMVPTPKISK